MILFTPNTVIKSADVNLNFDDHESRIAELESPAPTVFAWRPSGSGATLGMGVIGGYTSIINTGGAFNSSTGVFTAQKAGNYFISFTGFKNSDTGSGQLSLRKNSQGGTSGFRNFTSSMGGSYYVPISITAILPCSVNDTLDIYVESGLTLHGNQTAQLVILYVGKT